MRIIGIILVVLGALALGYGDITYTPPARPEGNPAATNTPKTVRIPPVVSGIVVVGGLLMIATASRRE